jgi:BirA family biotin operon repressor/biotin-[acetyl-CoA-carboxylase] ligase
LRPNDLWLIDDRGHSGSHDGRVPAMLPGRKLAGVLIETTPYGADRVAVIGVGVNVLSQQVDEAASGCACWAEIEPQATPETTLARVLDPLADALGRFQREGFAAFAARYAARDLLRGRCIAAAGAHGPIEGVACGVSAGGELLLQTARGVVAIGSGEVRLRLLPTGQAAPPARQRAGSPTC